jgi:hypothetical protein
MNRIIASAVAAASLTISMGVAGSVAADEASCTATKYGPGENLTVSGPTDDGDSIRQFACYEDAVKFVHDGFVSGRKVFAVDDNGFIAETAGGWVARVGGPLVNDGLEVVISEG